MSSYHSICPKLNTSLDLELSAQIPGMSAYDCSWYRAYNDYLAASDTERPLFDELSKEEKVEVLRQLHEDVTADEEIRKYKDAMGKASESRSYLYNIFNSSIPTELQAPVISDIAGEFSTIVNLEIRKKKTIHPMSRMEVITEMGIDTIFYKVRERLEKRMARIAKTKLEHPEYYHEEAGIDQVKSENELRKLGVDNVDKIINDYYAYNTLKTLLSVPGLWTAAIMLSKQALLDTERVKLGHDSELVSFVESLSDLENESNELQEGNDSAADIIDAENTTLEHWMLKADTLSALSGISAEVRSFLNTIFIPGQYGVLGANKRIDTKRAYLTLLSLRLKSKAPNSEMFLAYLGSVADGIREYEDLKEEYNTDGEEKYYVSELEELSETGIAAIYDKLMDMNEPDSPSYNPSMFHMLSTLLFCNFDKAACSYSIVDYVRDGKVCSRIELNLGETATTSETLGELKNAIITFKGKDRLKHSIFSESGQIDRTKLGEFSDYLVNGVLQGIKNGILKHNKGEEEKDKESRGIDIINTKADIINRINEALFLKDLFEVDTESLLQDSEESNDLFYNFIESTLAYISDLARQKNTDFTDTTHFKNIADTLEKYTQSTVISYKKRTVNFESSTRFGNSTYFHNINKCSLTQRMETINSYLIRENRRGLRSYLEYEFLRNPVFADVSFDKDGNITSINSIHHDWLRELIEYCNADEHTSYVETPYIKALKDGQFLRGLGNRDGYQEWQSFNDSENYRFTIAHFMYNYLNNGGKLGMVPTFVLGDADSVRFIPSTTLDCSRTGNYRSKFINVLKQELADLSIFTQLHEFLSTNNITGVGAFEGKIGFNYFPVLRQQIIDGTVTVENIKDDLVALEDGNISEKDFYEKWIAPSLRQQLEDFKNEMIGRGLCLKTEDDSNGNIQLNTSLFPEKYENSIQSFNLNSDFSAIEIIFLNYKFGEIQHIQFSGISPSFYVNIEDMQKRWKENIAPGRTLDLAAKDAGGNRVFTETDEHGIACQRVAYFKDFSYDSYHNEQDWRDYLELLHAQGLPDTALDLYGKDGKHSSSVTDGQAYRSLESYRAIQIALGDWYRNPRNEEAYSLIMSVRKRGQDAIEAWMEKQKAEGKSTAYDDIPEDVREQGELTKSEWRTLIDIGAVFQPLKPFLYTTEKIDLEDGKVADIPVQHKYAEIPLIPELLPIDSPLRKIGRTMNHHKIDLMASTKCVKVGGFNYVEFNIEDSQDNINAAFVDSDDMSKTHKLRLDTYFMQTNVPEHLNTFRGEGTQVRKILSYTGTIDMVAEICKSLAEYGSITIGDRTFNTSEAMEGKQLQSLITAIEAASWCQSAKEFKETLTDPKKLTTVIENSIANDSKSPYDRLRSISMREGTTERIVPLSEGLYGEDVMAQILSMFRKRVVKQETHGGTAVQIAPLGMDLKMHFIYDESGKPINIDYVEGAITFDFKVTNENGQVVELDYLEYVNPRTGKLLKEDGTDADNADESKLCKQYPKICNLLAYRVPTERAYSTIAVKMTRFFPKTMGGVLALPKQYTTISGFDFDIDKLYYLLRMYIRMRSREKFDDDEKNLIWARVYETHGIREALEEARDESYRRKRNYWEKRNPRMISLLDAQHQEDVEQGGHLNRYWAKAAKSHPDLFAGIDKQRAFNEAAEALGNEGALDDYHVTLNPFESDRDLTNQPYYILNNLKFDYMWDRWGSPSTAVERFTPGGFYKILEETPLMKMIHRNEIDAYPTLAQAIAASKTYKDSYQDPSDMTTAVHYQVANAIAGQLIGVAANQNIHQKLVSMLDFCRMVSHEIVNDKESEPLDAPILFGSMIDSAKIDKNVGVDLVPRYLGGEDSESNLSENLAGAVDAVKQATQEFFAITPKVFGMVALAVKVGATPRDVGLLFNQPVVREALRLMELPQGPRQFASALKQAYKALSGKDFTRPTTEEKVTLNQDALYEGIYNYKGGYKTPANIVTPSDRKSKSGLNTSIGIQTSAVQNSQRAVVDILLSLAENAKEFNYFLSAGKGTSANSVGSKISSLEHLLYSTEKTITEFGQSKYGSRFSLQSKGSKENKIFDLDSDLFHEDGSLNLNTVSALIDMPFGIEQMVLYMVKDMLENTKVEFPYRSAGYMAVKDLAAKIGRNYNMLSKKGVPSEAILEIINRDLPTYLLTQYAKTTGIASLEPFNIDAISKPIYNKYVEHVLENYRNEDDGSIVTREYDKEVEDASSVKGTKHTSVRKATINYFIDAVRSFKSIPEETFRKSHDGKSPTDYAIFNLIEVKEGKYGAYLEFKDLGRLESAEKNVVMDSWVAMLNSGDELLQYFAEQLFIYDFCTKGLNSFSTYVANSVTPSQVKEHFVGYLDFVRKLSSLRTEGDSFVIEDANVGKVVFGSVTEFMTLALLNTIDPYQRSNKCWEYIYTLNENEVEEIKRLDDDTKTNLENTETRVAGEAAINEGDIRVIIEDPSNNTALSGILQSSAKLGDNTFRQFYPIIRIDNRVYQAIGDGEGVAPLATMAAESTSGEKPVVSMNYRLVVGNTMVSSRTSPATTDYTSLNGLDTVVMYTGAEEDSGALEESSPTPEESAAGEGSTLTGETPRTALSFYNEVQEEVRAKVISQMIDGSTNFMSNLKNAGEHWERAYYAIMDLLLLNSIPSTSTGVRLEFSASSFLRNHPAALKIIQEVLENGNLEINDANVAMLEEKAANAREQNLCN